MYVFMQLFLSPGNCFIQSPEYWWHGHTRVEMSCWGKGCKKKKNKRRKKTNTHERLSRISDEGAADWHARRAVYSTRVLEEHTHTHARMHTYCKPTGAHSKGLHAVCMLNMMGNYCSSVIEDTSTQTNAQVYTHTLQTRGSLTRETHKKSSSPTL